MTFRPDLFNVLGKDSSGNDFQIKLDANGSSLFIGPNDVSAVGGTWTLTRNAQGDVSLNKTAAADTTYLIAPLRKLLKTVAQSGLYNGTGADDRGIKITSIDVIYSIGTLALTSQTPTVNRIVFSNNVANAVTAHGGSISGSLATATQTNPYVSTLTLGTPVFDMTADSDVNLEIAIVAAATSVYKFYGIVVNFDQNSI